ncbi:phage minor capsid protein [Actinoplanes sp. CA-252034]|uniref:phage minor capsid protein n=1 Tax=Actinoplanes sp. CA-252034 TaxID=3239906 RepID=UPI003D95C136
MAVDPERLAEIVRATVDLYREGEDGLLRLVTRYLAQGIDTPAWALERLAALRQLRSAAEAVLDRISDELAGTVLQAVADAYAAGDTSLLGDLPREVAIKAGARATAAVPRSAAMEALAQALVQDIGARHSNVLRHVVDAYQQVVAAATASSVGGGLTRRQAAQLAYARLVEQGVSSFTDRRGRRWRMSTYVEMALRTVTQRAAVQGQTDRQARLGLPYVMVSNESQECERCRPYEGRILRVDAGATGSIEVPHQISGQPVQIEVKATLEQARAAGFQHPNCRHSVRAYLPGVTRLPEKPTADPAGDEARQRQRAIERAIRRWKERELAALTPQDAAQAHVKVALWQGQMRAHLTAHPTLKRLPYREQIGAGSLPRVPRPAAPPPPAPPTVPPPPPAPAPAPPALPQRRPVRQTPDRIEDLPGLLNLDLDAQLNRDMARDVFADIIGGEYASLVVKVQSVSTQGGITRRGLHITGKIFASDDPNAAEAGVFARGFYRDRDGDLVAIHALLHLDNAYRGKGFAGAFNGHLEKWYRQQGIVRIEVHANIDVGGYTWATQGFQFEDEVSALDILDRLRFVISVFTDRVQAMRDEARTAVADRARTLREQANKFEAQMAEAEDILERADQARFGDDDYPTSWEISQCGRSHDIAVKDRPWIGKAAMLGSDWHGVKWL